MFIVNPVKPDICNTIFYYYLFIFYMEELTEPKFSNVFLLSIIWNIRLLWLIYHDIREYGDQTQVHSEAQTEQIYQIWCSYLYL